MTSLSNSTVDYQLVTPAEATAMLDELCAVYLAVFGEPPHSYGAEHGRLFRERFVLQHRRRGAALITARARGRLVGFAFGLTLTSSRSWWFDLATEVDPELTREPPGRTFALLELGVLGPWRRSGVATRLHDHLLRHRNERRATLTVLPDAVAARAFYARHGWYKVAQKYNPLPGSPLFDVLVRDLRRPPTDPGRPPELTDGGPGGAIAGV